MAKWRKSATSFTHLSAESLQTLRVINDVHSIQLFCHPSCSVNSSALHKLVLLVFSSKINLHCCLYVSSLTSIFSPDQEVVDGAGLSELLTYLKCQSCWSIWAHYFPDALPDGYQIVYSKFRNPKLSFRPSQLYIQEGCSKEMGESWKVPFLRAHQHNRLSLARN